MPVTTADIVTYGSATMPNDDSGTEIGGAISTATRVVFTDIVATDQVEILSDNAGDTTQTVTIYGRLTTGELSSDALSLNGTTVVLSTATFERILRVTVSAAHAGTITIRDQDTDAAIMAIETGVTEVRRVFYNAAAEATGGAARDYYEKIFMKNNHGSITLTDSVVSEQTDPSGFITFAVEASLDGTGTNGSGNNRQTVGSLSGLTFNSTAKNVVNSQNLTAGSAQGIWLKLSLAAGTAAANTTYSLTLAGNTV